MHGQEAPDFVTTTPLQSDTVGTGARSPSSRNQRLRDKPSPFQLMVLTYRNVRRRVDDGNESAAATCKHTQAADGTALSIIQWSKREELKLDYEQQLAFRIVTAAYILTYYEDAETADPSLYRDSSNSPSQVRRDFISEKSKLLRLATLKQLREPLFMFLSVAGGSRKSRVVKEVIKYAEEYTSNLGLKFDMRTIIVSAMSGVAAISIGGETLHSVAALNKKESSKEDIESWANARLLIIDEVSFMNTKDVEKLDERLQQLRQKYTVLFGGIHILFCGDFRQLEPIAGNPLYSSFHSEKKWISAINCYIELQGLHRFADDPEWGRILSRIRKGTYTFA